MQGPITHQAGSTVLKTGQQAAAVRGGGGRSTTARVHGGCERHRPPAKLTAVVGIYAFSSQWRGWLHQGPLVAQISVPRDPAGGASQPHVALPPPTLAHIAPTLGVQRSFLSLLLHLHAGCGQAAATAPATPSTIPWLCRAWRTCGRPCAAPPCCFRAIRGSTAPWTCGRAPRRSQRRPARRLWRSPAVSGAARDNGGALQPACSPFLLACF